MYSRVSELVNFLQIQNSRVNRLKEKELVVGLFSYCDHLADILEVRARCDMLFDFARYSKQDAAVFYLA
jgi:hypothetical protein